MGHAATRFLTFPKAFSLEETCDSLLSYFFLANHSPTANTLCSQFNEYSPIIKVQITQVLSRSLLSSAPGPNSILYAV